VYNYDIFKNALPQCDVFADDDYTKEEIKLMTEPKKILGDDSFNISATAVRVPVQGGHSESVNVEFENDFDLDEIREILSNTPGVVVLDDVKNNIYPMPLYSEGKDEVFVGRIRRDLSQPKTLNLWIVADNLRKGAATNAVQIAEYLCKNELV
jgi:aspartate-semialdehyde dehydrogenase